MLEGGNQKMDNNNSCVCCFRNIAGLLLLLSAVGNALAQWPLDNWQYLEIDNAREQGAFGIGATDLNKDGYMEMVSGPYLYANPGLTMEGTWQRQRLPLGLDAVMGDALMFYDVDGDEFTDIIAMECSDILWLEASDQSGDDWSRIKVGELPTCSHELSVEDYAVKQMNGGGKEEIILLINGIFILETPENPEEGAWPLTKVINIGREASGQEVDGFAVHDMDQDGLPDIVVGGAENILDVFWYKNPGTISLWPQSYKIGSTEYRSDRVVVLDVNGDGLPDVLTTEESMHDPSNLTWFEQPAGGAADENWTGHVIIRQAFIASMETGDLDNDGDLDVVTGEWAGEQRVQIWENLGTGAFNMHLVQEGRKAGRPISDAGSMTWMRTGIWIL
jgi:hypothetical protein